MKYDDLSLKEDPIFLTLRRNMHVLSFSINFSTYCYRHKISRTLGYCIDFLNM